MSENIRLTQIRESERKSYEEMYSNEEFMLTTIEWAQEFYHYDIPLTVQHEREALLEAGFANVEILNSWGATYTLKVCRA